MASIATPFDTVVVGGGQAGLAAGYHLARRGRRFVILDAGPRPGESWRQRWDSLRLFTPAGYSHLPGTRLPLNRSAFPTKTDMADYLADYAIRHALPVEHGVRVERLSIEDGRLRVDAGPRHWVARNVIAATGAHAVARTPDFAGELDPAIVQLTALTYRSAAQLPAGAVLVVGAGNSGAEIALDLATRSETPRPVFLAGRDVGVMPRLGRSSLLYPLLRMTGHRGARAARRRLGRGGDPLGQTRPAQLTAAGIVRLPRVVGARAGTPVLATGRTVDVAAVVWCTGSTPEHSWLPPTLLDETGSARHHRGVTEQPGLYVLGLPFQSRITSHLVGGVGVDAADVVEHFSGR